MIPSRVPGPAASDSCFNPTDLGVTETKRVKLLQTSDRLTEQRLCLRGLVVLVHYTITLEVDSSGITNDTLDFISLQNNLVEKNYPGAAEQPTVVYTITDFRNYITEALHKDNFLSNSSLEQPENLVPAVKPTSRPADPFDMVSKPELGVLSGPGL